MVENFRLVDGVLSGIAVDYEPHIVRHVGAHLLDNADNFLEFFHQVVFVVQTASGIYQHHVATAGHSRIAGIERHGRRVRAFLMLHEFGTRTLRRGFQLINGRRAECIAGGNHHLLALVLQAGGKLTDGGRFTGTVYANHKHHVGLTLEFKRRRVLEQAFRFTPHDVKHLFCRK